MKKVLNYLYIVLFLGLLLVPLIKTNRKPYSVSEIDNRALAEAPEFGQENFPAAFETYLNDRIGFRNEMINTYNVINDILADELTHPLYIYGKDGQVFLNMTPNVTYKEYHEKFAQFVKSMQDYCEAHGVGFYFAFEPEKISVLRDYLPDGVNYEDAWVDQLMAKMDELGVNYIDNRDVLVEKSKTEKVFDVQYDAGHWNDLGAFYGTNNIFKRIHEDYPIVTEMSEDEFEITTEEAEYLPVSQFEVNEMVPRFTLKQEWTDETLSYNTGLKIDSNHRHFHYFTNNYENAEELPKMLFFQGSYYNNRPQFFVSRTSEDVGVHNYQNVFELDYYLNAFDPDIVVFEVAEYTILDAYFSESRLLSPGWNPPVVDMRNEASFEDQINAYLSNAVTMYEKDLFVLEYDELEKLYLYSDDLRTAQYLYLYTDGRVLDLSRDENGFFEAMVDKDTDLSDALLIVETYDGEKFVYPMNVRQADFLQEFGFAGTSNAKKVTDPSIFRDELGRLNEPFELKASEKGKFFVAFGIELWDINATRTISTLCMTSSEGDINTSFSFGSQTGWYRLRLRGISDNTDEHLDFPVFLRSGEYYSLSCILNKMSKEQIVFSDFRIVGPGGYGPYKEDLLGKLTSTSGTRIGSDGSIVMTTDLVDNRFNAVILMTLSSDVPGQFSIAANETGTGTMHGYYCHTIDSGSYRVILKANSNKSDEMVEFTADLQQYALYEYSFEIVSQDSKRVEIRNLQFYQLSD
ncbi:MAG: hypothetical protein IK109_07680 [Clostridiales bacterium]|nr:hypothetical protein [Clostridiales bacterium]